MINFNYSNPFFRNVNRRVTNFIIIISASIVLPISFFILFPPYILPLNKIYFTLRYFVPVMFINGVMISSYYRHRTFLYCVNTPKILR